MIYKNKQYNKGYTLLFAVLVSSLVLSVGISILNISKKEFLLSSSARESTIAFYAADSGLECAAYWDRRSKFSTTISTDPIDIRCANHAIYQHNGRSYSFSPNNGYIYTTFDIRPSIGSTACATIEVKKPTAENGVTTIESRGYNMGWNPASGCVSPSPKRVERAVQYTYDTTPPTP